MNADKHIQEHLAQPAIALNENDIENLGFYFDQNGIANKLDKNTDALLRLSEINLAIGSEMKNDAIYNLMVVRTAEAKSLFNDSIENLKSNSIFSNICNELKIAADRSRSTIAEYCSTQKDNKLVRELMDELNGLKKSDDFLEKFHQMELNYAELKDGISGITEHTSSLIGLLPEDDKLAISGDYTKFTNEVFAQVDAVASSVYLPLNQNNTAIDLQSDFKQFIEGNLSLIKNVEKHYGSTHEQDVGHSLQNSF